MAYARLRGLIVFIVLFCGFAIGIELRVLYELGESLPLSYIHFTIFILKEGLTELSKLAFDSFHGEGWPCTFSPPVSAS